MDPYLGRGGEKKVDGESQTEKGRGWRVKGAGFDPDPGH